MEQIKSFLKSAKEKIIDVLSTLYTLVVLSPLLIAVFIEDLIAKIFGKKSFYSILAKMKDQDEGY